MDSAENSSEQTPLRREELHFRGIEMRGFSRSDGLYEIEGRLRDQKPHDFAPPNDASLVPAGQPLHDMGVRLVFDRSMQVLEVHTFTHTAPYPPCPQAGQALQSLVGLCMASGWNKEVRSRLAGVRSCTHLVELLGPMATTAFQSLAVANMAGPDRLTAAGVPVQIDSCYAYSAERELVLKRWPRFYRPPGVTT